MARAINYETLRNITQEVLGIDRVTLKDLEGQYSDPHTRKVELLRRWRNKSTGDREVSQEETRSLD